MYLYLRPGIYDFLDTLYEKFELILFNNASKNFTEPIVKEIIEGAPFGSKNYFSHVLSKEHLTVNDDKHEVKNLDLFCNFDSNRDLESCLIIDNSIYSF